MGESANGSLTGLWLGDDKAIYYVRHHLGRIWWIGLSADSPLGADEFHPGVRFANVFCGRMAGDIVLGEWADTPRGGMPQNGIIDLVVDSDSQMRAVHEVGGFGGRLWRRVEKPHQISVTERIADFDRIGSKRGRVYAETAVVQGTVVTEPFMLDGDIVLSVRPDQALSRLPGAPSARLADQPLQCRIPDVTGSSFLPGWKQRDGNSVLFSNGQPVNGGVSVASDGSVRILDRRITPGTEIRVSGFLSAQQEEPERRADAPFDDEALLLGPVYSLDIVEPIARGTLTGTWAGDDHGTYYLRQVGSTLWWMGLSHDQGRSFSNMFCGAILRNGGGTEVIGDLVDLPLGERQDSSRITLRVSENTMLTATGGSATRWSKLSDTFR
ncbi:hypothetical protein ACIBEA_08205 [Streptomyces sp. NPDC051555]|uniref:hypothetical protein n=1 Tax=Streptomyces sp. NPDC051555 TaxID=3365657 RepID=UPI0037B551FA